jgi:hypothetical protein
MPLNTYEDIANEIFRNSQCLGERLIKEKIIQVIRQAYGSEPGMKPPVVPYGRLHLSKDSDGQVWVHVNNAGTVKAMVNLGALSNRPSTVQMAIEEVFKYQMAPVDTPAPITDNRKQYLDCLLELVRLKKLKDALDSFTETPLLELKDQERMDEMRVFYEQRKKKAWDNAFGLVL